MLPLLLSLAQGSNPNPAALATLERPRLTYAEFGAWVQNRTHTPVTVGVAIRDRKATVLVANRPVGETMAAFAQTFGLVWERTTAGLALRLDPKVAREEREVLDAESREAEAGLLEDLEAAMTLGSLTPEALAARLDAVEESNDPVSERRRFRIDRIGRDGALLAAGEALAALPPADRVAILKGQRTFANEKGGPGLAQVSNRWMATILRPFEGAGDPDSPQPVPSGIGLVLQGDPARRRLLVNAMVLGADGKGFATSQTRFEYDWLFDDAPSSLSRRWTAWAQRDPSTLATRLQADATPLPSHSSSLNPLADALVVLHQRSGLPVLADGFREAAFAGKAPEGTTVGEWLAGVEGVAIAQGQPPLVRARDGWIEFRHPRYWRRLAEEPSEKAIVALERSALGLDDLAAFVATLTPIQTVHLSTNELVMDVPNESVDGNVPFLQLWRALTASQRKQALGDDGLSLSRLTGVARERLLDALGEMEGDTDPGDAALPYFMPGGPPLPPDLTLSVEAREEIGTTEFPPFPRHAVSNPSPRAPIERRYTGFAADITGADRTFRFYQLPLRPKER